MKSTMTVTTWIHRTYPTAWLGLALLLLGLPFDAARANGFRNPPESAAALGQVGAYYVNMDDVSAMAFNPANLAAVTNVAVKVNGLFVYSKAKFTSPMGFSAVTGDAWNFLPSAFAAAPLSRDLVLGIAVTTPYGQATHWSPSGPMSAIAPYSAALTTVDVAPTVAWRLYDTLWFGASLDVYWGRFSMEQIYPWATVTKNPLTPPGVAKLSGDGEGVGCSAGLTWQPAPRHTLALAAHSPVKLSFQGDTEFSNVPAGLPPSMRTSDFDTDITLPTTVGLGYGLRVTDTLRVGVDVEWLEFSAFDQLALDAGANNALLPVRTIREDWNDTWTAGIGASWDCCRDWILRGGYIFMPTPVPDGTLSPTLPDGDQHVLSAGLGFHRGGHAVDLAYALGLNQKRTVQSEINPAWSGTYDIKPSHLVSVSYGYTF